jgi:hypothetical protein
VGNFRQCREPVYKVQRMISIEIATPILGAKIGIALFLFGEPA